MKTNILSLVLLLISPFIMAIQQDNVANGVSNQKEIEKDVLTTMKKATRFMMDKVSYKGGFVWNYLPDFSRSWGEMEAKRTMVWIQPPGTPTVGNMLLNTYLATHDEYYYNASIKVAKTLIKGQLPCGGWNYVFDLAGEDSLKKWYETIGKNGWRLEEFQHYYGNATFDDGGTIQAGKFLLRLYLLKKDPKIGAALEKVIMLVLDSQYPIGGWPQRYPLMNGFTKNGKSDYTPFITLNDDVLLENIDFLTLCYQTLKREELKEPIYRAMYCCKKLQQGPPYSGWSDQYTMDLKPAHARSYEPCAVNTGTTAHYVMIMMDFYKVTGDTSFLSGIPAAIRFIESQKLSESTATVSGRMFGDNGSIMLPRFVDPDTGKPLFIHRKGSNVANGCYYADQNPAGTIVHYSSFSSIDPSILWGKYEEIKKVKPKEAMKDSPFNGKWGTPPPLIITSESRRPDLFAPNIDQILSKLNQKGYWPTPLSTRSNPYIGDGTSEGGEETKYSQTSVGDLYDTSCFRKINDVESISVSVYLMNMGQLIKYLTSER